MRSCEVMLKLWAVVFAGTLLLPISTAGQSVNDAAVAAIVVTVNQVDVDAGKVVCLVTCADEGTPRAQTFSDVDSRLSRDGHHRMRPRIHSTPFLSDLKWRITFRKMPDTWLALVRAIQVVVAVSSIPSDQ
jgi:hypothetical protein